MSLFFAKIVNFLKLVVSVLNNDLIGKFMCISHIKTIKNITILIALEAKLNSMEIQNEKH